MSTKSGHDVDQSGHGEVHSKHHHGDHGKHHHSEQGKHHGDQHYQRDPHHGAKHPPLREAVMKAGKGDGGSIHGGHGQPHGRPRAGTLTRRDTGHGFGQSKHHGKGHEYDRQSVGRQSEGHPPSLVEYENTYRLEPDDNFQESKVREIIAKTFEENLQEKDYDPRIMNRRCLELSDVIKERVKHLHMSRYKIVCVVLIGQIMDQSMMITSRCLWNHNYDNFSTFTLKKSAYYAVGMVFGMYAE